MKKLLLIALLTAGLNSFAQENNTKTEKTLPKDTYFHMMVEKKPLLNGTENGFYEYIGKNFIYPQELEKDLPTAMVYVQFTIDKEGQTKDIKILNSPHELLSETVIDLLKKSPKWTPGEHKGQIVNVIQTVPLKFSPNN